MMRRAIAASLAVLWLIALSVPALTQQPDRDPDSLAAVAHGAFTAVTISLNPGGAIDLAIVADLSRPVGNTLAAARAAAVSRQRADLVADLRAAARSDAAGDGLTVLLIAAPDVPWAEVWSVLEWCAPDRDLGIAGVQLAVPASAHHPLTPLMLDIPESLTPQLGASTPDNLVVTVAPRANGDVELVVVPQGQGEGRHGTSIPASPIDDCVAVLERHLVLESFGTDPTALVAPLDGCTALQVARVLGTMADWLDNVRTRVAFGTPAGVPVPDDLRPALPRGGTALPPVVGTGTGPAPDPARTVVVSPAAAVVDPTMEGSVVAFRNGEGRLAPDVVVAARIDVALRWLADHQQPNGEWLAEGFHNATTRNRGEWGNLDGSDDRGWPTCNIAVSALSVLAFLGSGHTHREGPYRETLRRGLRFLKAVQDRDGCFQPAGEEAACMPGHAIGTIAMVEAYALTGSALLKGPAQAAVDYIVETQRRGADTDGGGWSRLAPGNDSDTMTTGWMVMALTAARRTGLDVPELCLQQADAYMDRMTVQSNQQWRTGFNQPGGGGPRLASRVDWPEQGTSDAINVLVHGLRRDVLEPDEHLMLRSQTSRLLTDGALPDAEPVERRDFFHWFAGSIAMWQVGDEAWARWHPAVEEAVLATQRMADGPGHRCQGSWDSKCAWGPAGGRVYATAINCLTLQVCSRHVPERQQPDPDAMPGDPPAAGDDGSGDDD